MINFCFNPASLATPRKPGISAYMRIKNEQQFLRLCIESHLPFYDEIVCVYNDCNDNTEAILKALQAEHPDKIKVFHYLPKVHPVRTSQHAVMVGQDDNVHSIANYCNFALSKCTYCIATKLDADHLAIPHKLKLALAKIRSEFAAGADKIFLFSGLNVVRGMGGELGMRSNGEPFSGNGDIAYHRIDARSFFTNHTTVEHFNQQYRFGVAAEYVGVLYIHLQALKHRPEQPELVARDCISLEQFTSKPHLASIAARLKLTRRLRLQLHRYAPFAKLMHRLTRRYPAIRIARLLTLPADLHDVDLQRDAEAWLDKFL